MSTPPSTGGFQLWEKLPLTNNLPDRERKPHPAGKVLFSSSFEINCRFNVLATVTSEHEAFYCIFDIFLSFVTFCQCSFSLHHYCVTVRHGLDPPSSLLWLTTKTRRRGGLCLSTRLLFHNVLLRPEYKILADPDSLSRPLNVSYYLDLTSAPPSHAQLLCTRTVS